MKKKFFKKIFLLIFLLQVYNVVNAMGLFYTNSSYPVTATGAKIDLAKLKFGSSDSINVLWCVEVGDAGIEKAMKNGGINKISFIDINEKTFFIFFKKITTIVYGE